MCRWAAARPLAVRAASFARRVGSKPGQAPPPPTGTAAGPFGALHAGGAVLLCVAECVVSKPGQVAAQRHRGVTHRPRVSCPTLACRIAEPTLNFARNSPATISNIEFRSLELQRFGTLLRLHPIELRATFLGAWPCCPSNFACNSLECVSWFEV